MKAGDCHSDWGIVLLCYSFASTFVEASAVVTHSQWEMGLGLLSRVWSIEPLAPKNPYVRQARVGGLFVFSFYKGC